MFSELPKFSFLKSIKVYFIAFHTHEATTTFTNVRDSSEVGAILHAYIVSDCVVLGDIVSTRRQLYGRKLLLRGPISSFSWTDLILTYM